MSPDDVTIYPREGQFWALTKPLRLAQCLIGGEEVLHFKGWSPEAYNDENDPLIYVGPVSDSKYLWYMRAVTIDVADRMFGGQSYPGDVWMLREIHPKLFFIGPSESEHILLLANWDMDEVIDAIVEEGTLLTRLFQPGPHRQAPRPVEPPGAIDRLLEGRELV